MSHTTTRRRMIATVATAATLGLGGFTLASTAMAAPKADNPVGQCAYANPLSNGNAYGHANGNQGNGQQWGMSGPMSGSGIDDCTPQVPSSNPSPDPSSSFPDPSGK